MASEITTRRRASNLMSMREELDSLFNRFFEGWPNFTAEGAYLPAVDIGESENEVVLKVELPGLQAEDIDVSVRDNNLIISGEKRESKEERQETYYHIERRYGSFYRNIPLGTIVDPEKIDASFKDGVLTVKLPKAEQAKMRKIKVKGE